jgi:hypothetical protein
MSYCRLSFMIPPKNNGLPRFLSRQRGGGWALVVLSLLLTGAPLAVDAQPKPAEAVDAPAAPSASAKPWNQPVTARRQQPSWARHDWQRRRPWSHGWYGIGWQNNVPTWGWWRPQAASWGIRNLASAAEINKSVSEAIDAKKNAIPVAGSSYQLMYGSLTVPNDRTVTFVVERNGRSFSMDADCQAGSLNGTVPNDAAEAQLLHAACQVAFGPG